MSDDNLRKSGEIIGMAVSDVDGVKIGTIREVILDPDRGEARFAILDAGGLFGGGGKYHPLPWRLLRFNPRDGFRAEVTKERVRQSPAYDREQLGSYSYGWDEQSERYFEMRAP